MTGLSEQQLAEVELSADLLAEIRAVNPGEWCQGPWTQDPVEGPEGESGHFVVKDADGTTVATLPQWAGPLALFIVVARDGMPAMLTEVERLAARVAALEAERHETNAVLDEVVRALRAGYGTAITEAADELARQTVGERLVHRTKLLTLLREWAAARTGDAL
jgi:hypothetical protein